MSRLLVSSVSSPPVLLSRVRKMSVLSTPWGNTNRVVSNQFVSKGPLYPSKTKIIIFCVFDTTPFICL